MIQKSVVPLLIPRMSAVPITTRYSKYAQQVAIERHRDGRVPHVDLQMVDAGLHIVTAAARSSAATRRSARGRGWDRARRSRAVPATRRSRRSGARACGTTDRGDAQLVDRHVHQAGVGRDGVRLAATKITSSRPGVILLYQRMFGSSLGWKRRLLIELQRRCSRRMRLMRVMRPPRLPGGVPVADLQLVLLGVQVLLGARRERRVLGQLVAAVDAVERRERGRQHQAHPEGGPPAVLQRLVQDVRRVRPQVAAEVLGDRRPA